MARDLSKVDCPHCNQSTSLVEVLCEHCGGYLRMSDVLVADGYRASVVNGATAGRPDEKAVVLLTFDGHVDSASDTPTNVTISIRPDAVTRLSALLMDTLMSVAVQIQAGSHDQDCDR